MGREMEAKPSDGKKRRTGGWRGNMGRANLEGLKGIGGKEKETEE